MTARASRTGLPELSQAQEELLVKGLFEAARTFRHRLRPELDREGLTSPMFWALHQIVSEGPLSVGEIAGACVVTPANISSAAERLETAGLVVRSSSAPDRRVVRLTATPRGRSLHRAVARRLGRVLVESLGGLASADVEGTLRVLGRLAATPAGLLAHPEVGAT